MNNLINQQVAFDLLMSRARELTGITGDLGGACVGAARLIKSLPSAESKTGEWIYHKNTMSCVRWSKWECSVCHDKQEYKTDYCPNCGADMRGKK